MCSNIEAFVGICLQLRNSFSKYVWPLDDLRLLGCNFKKLSKVDLNCKAKLILQAIASRIPIIVFTFAFAGE